MREYLRSRVFHIPVNSDAQTFIRFFGPKYPEVIFAEPAWKIQCKLPPKTKAILPP